MRGILEIVIAAASLLPLAPVPVHAQPPPGDERYHSFGRAILDRVRGDLARAERDLRYVPPRELRRFGDARGNLADFQRKWERGRYDRGDLDRGIGNLAALVDRSRLHPRDRDLLADDLRRLRDLRGRIERGPH